MQPPSGGGSRQAAAVRDAAATSGVPFASTGSRLRVLSFNVNGLRACLKRLRLKTMAQLLNQLNADIVCFQETKLRRADVDSELACVDGWDSFFCCDTTSATGYSGTATYCRTQAALPFAAEEGFTGCAALATAEGNAGAAMSAACPHPALLGEFSVEELTELDSEGRVVVTDHGAFVLFNLYGPAITSEDAERAEQRTRFKHRFYQALEMRWRDLLTQGRAVVAVGDFNICPAPIDCAEPDPANHYRSASRRWMRHLLRGTVASAAARGLQQAALPATAGAQQQPATPGAAGQLQGGGSSVFDWEAAEAAEAAEEGDGSTSPRWQGSAGPDASSCASCIGGRGSPLSENCCFVDTFRHFHPTRTDVATCWSTLTNARVNDYGSRIDLVLTAGLHVGQPPLAALGTALPLPPASAPTRGGSWSPPDGRANNGLCSSGTPAGESGSCGSGAPASSVWVVASEIWKQQEGSDHCPVYADFASAGGAFPCSARAPATAMRFAFAAKQHKLHRWLAPVQPSSGRIEGLPQQVQQAQQQARQQAQQPAGRPVGAAGAEAGSLAGSQASCDASQGGSQTSSAIAGAAGRRECKKQASLKAFFQRSAAQQQQTQHAQQQQLQQQEGQLCREGEQQAEQQGHQGTADELAAAKAEADAATAAEAVAAAGADLAARQEQSRAAWAGLLARNKPPQCRHGEAAALLKVNKQGPNKGRWFYTCARAAGPPPEGKCNFFKWVEKKAGDPAHLTLDSSGSAPASKRLKV